MARSGSAVVLVPEGRSSVQSSNDSGIVGCELAPKDVREEMVIAVFRAGRVERY